MPGTDLLKVERKQKRKVNKMNNNCNNTDNYNNVDKYRITIAEHYDLVPDYGCSFKYEKTYIGAVSRYNYTLNTWEAICVKDYLNSIVAYFSLKRFIRKFKKSHRSINYAEP